MVWIYLAESVDSPKPWRVTCDLSPIVKTTDMLKVSSYLEWEREISLLLLSGTTLRHYADPTYPDHPRSSMAVFPAKTLAWQDAERAWGGAAADFSSRSLGSLAKYDPATSSWRTSQLSLFEAQSELLESFAAYGMTVDGVFSPLRMWARITGENDGGSWPTPTTNPDSPNMGSNKKEGPKSLGAAARYGSRLWRTPDTGAGDTSGLLKSGKKRRKSGAAITIRLVDQVNNPHMWPTPTSSDDRGPGSNMLDLGRAAKMWPTPTAEPFRSRGGDRKDEMGLDRMAKMFPTPTVHGNNNKPKAGTKRGTGLSSAAKMWPTPKGSSSGPDYARVNRPGSGGDDLATAIAKTWPTPTVQDAKNNGAPSQMERNTKPLNAEVGGSLNPTWVEWLMGYPSGWTVLKDWATQWFRPKRAKPLKG